MKRNHGGQKRLAILPLKPEEKPKVNNLAEGQPAHGMVMDTGDNITRGDISGSVPPFFISGRVARGFGVQYSIVSKITESMSSIDNIECIDHDVQRTG
jgi:hypothetical protein